MDPETTARLDTIEGMALAHREILATLAYKLLRLSTDPQGDVRKYSAVMRAAFDAALAGPGRKAPRPEVSHAALHELELFWESLPPIQG